LRLMRVGPAGAERPVALDEKDRAFDLSELTADIDGAFLAGDGIARVRRALADGSLPETAIEGERVGAPVTRPPSVVCVGLNYAAHAAESGVAPPSQPVVFFKHPNTVVGPDDDVLIPRGARKVDWEVELGVVIGRRARYVEPADALSHVAGYTVSNDVSERHFQLDPAVSGGQWGKGKCCETFNPLGPWLVPADEVDPASLRLRSFVNGEPRQDSTTADMIFGVAELVAHISQFMVLEPGDLLNTGTPQGVALSGRFPYLSVDDVMEIEIDGLGRQRQVLAKA
jgi:2,4-didehydro-3-deoxy-L-rhamnonate hydrolase